MSTGNGGIELSSDPEFPCGTLDGGTLIICLSSAHRKNVAEAFNKPARYVIPGANLDGGKYRNIIIFTPQVRQETDVDLMRFKNYIDNYVLLKLDGAGGKAYYV